MHLIAAEILGFWFETTNVFSDINRREVWFKSTPNFDQAVKTNFKTTHEKAAAGEYNSFMKNPEEALALIIALDQFPRNLYRGTAKAFQTDHLACSFSHEALANGYDAGMALEPKKFLYLPLVHSENLSDQIFAVENYKKLNDEKSLTSAVGHHDAIKKFGRFPHRNKILGRKNTKAETEYLKSPPTWGMTKAEAEDLEKKLGKS